MAKNDSNSGCGCFAIIIIAVIAAINTCKHSDKTDKSRDMDTIMSEIVDTTDEYIVEQYVDSDYVMYIDNHLSNGTHPYDNEASATGSESQFIVKTSPGESDVLVILKRNGMMVRNTYVVAGNYTTMDVPNGRYQIFFYYGKGWNPNKQMPNGVYGGFVSNEYFSKDEPQTLEYQSLTYELILQENGNFSAEPSNVNEVF